MIKKTEDTKSRNDHKEEGIEENTRSQKVFKFRKDRKADPKAIRQKKIINRNNTKGYERPQIIRSEK